MSIGVLFLLCQILGIIIHPSQSTPQSVETRYPIKSLPEPKLPTYRRINHFLYNTTSSLPPLNLTPINFLKESTTFTLYAQKGLKLYDQLLSGCTPEKFKPPTFTDLLSSDFDVFPLPLASGDRSSSALLPDILDAIGAGIGKDYFYVNLIDHDETSTYTATYSPASGLIAAISLSQSPSPHSSPSTIHWSDIAFALYTHTCTLTTPPSFPASLHYLIQAYITNDITLSILSAIIPPHQSGVFAFTPEGSGGNAKGFYALLASPNGAGGVWLLMQHQRVLGRKEVRRIVVWIEVGHAPDVVFELGELRVGEKGGSYW